MTCKRYDKITLDRSRAVRLDSGMLKVPARLSRTGVQEYRKADGTIERAYRPPEEVSKPESVQTFDMAPLVNDHPYADGSMVTAQNVKRLSVGTVGHPVYNNGFVEAMLLVADESAIAAVESGKVQLSAGYFMDRDETPGVTPDGQPYDFVQRNIKANHVAIVWAGRAGPEVRIQLDANPEVAFATDAEGMTFTAETPPKKEVTMKLVIDGSECEVSDLAATLIARERKAAEALTAAAKEEVTKVQKVADEATAKLAVADEKIAKLETELKAAPEKVRAEVAERVAFEAKVKAIAPEVKCDGLDTKAVKLAVIAKLSSIKCDGKSDDYVNAVFDTVCAEQEKKNPAADAADKELAARGETAPKPTGAKAAREAFFAEWANPSKK